MVQKSQPNCFCAFCKTPKRIAAQKNIKLPQLFSCFIITGILTFLIFQKPDLRGLFILAALLLVTELFYVLRWRASVICSICGFDPILYRRSPSQAALKVRFQLDKRTSNPAHLLKRPLDLPRISEERKRHLEKQMEHSDSDKGLIVSKSV